MRSEDLAKVVCTTVGQAEEEGAEGETRTGKDSSALVLVRTLPFGKIN